jgi:N-acylglucosamine-6-phosphate 2-epimerase
VEEKLMNALLPSLKNQLIVSVQAEHGEPLNTPEMLTAMAQACINGGAVGVRLAQPQNIAHFKKVCPHVPVIGITKPEPLPSNYKEIVYITPTWEAVQSVIQAGAEIVALDATLADASRPRMPGESVAEILEKTRAQFPNILLMADIATLEDGLAAAALGFDLIGTTLSGYTQNSLTRSLNPDFTLLETLVQKLPEGRIVLEGRISLPAQVTRAFQLGAFAVVVGSAITRPRVITQLFVQACKGEPILY